MVRKNKFNIHILVFLCELLATKNNYTNLDSIANRKKTTLTLFTSVTVIMSPPISLWSLFPSLSLYDAHDLYPFLF